MVHIFTEKEIIRMKTLDPLREIINKLNEDIVSAMHKRSELPGNVDMYAPQLDIELRNRGVDDVSAKIFLRLIYLKICDRENDLSELEEIAFADVTLQSKINERIFMGEPVAMWKYYHTASEKVVYKKREKQVLNQVAELANEHYLDEKAARYIFKNLIMKHTKEVEHCVLDQLRMINKNSTKTDGLARTACKDLIPVLIAQLGSKYEGCQFKHKEIMYNGSKHYEIHLID